VLVTARANGLGLSRALPQRAYILFEAGAAMRTPPGPRSKQRLPGDERARSSMS
jgi:hypothetical protein